METKQVNHIVKSVNNITGTEALDYILEGKELFFQDGFGMKSLIYDDMTFSYYFVNFEGQRIRTNWTDGHIVNQKWEIER